MPVHRPLIPLALLLSATVAAWSCSDSSPTDPGLAMPVFKPGGGGTSTKGGGLVGCAQPYDSVTQVIGPAGGVIAVGPHYLWIDVLALTSQVTITAVTPADTVRWVRLLPDGLRFQTGGAGPSAILYLNYKNCGVPTNSTPRVAQITDSLSIMAYLQGNVKSKKNAGGQEDEYYATGVLDHFSNYAIAW